MWTIIMYIIIFSFKLCHWAPAVFAIVIKTKYEKRGMVGKMVPRTHVVTFVPTQRRTLILFAVFQEKKLT